MLEDDDWEILIDRIGRKECTPFLGAGACYGVLPLGGDIAQEWASVFKYPFDDSTNLIRVAQFVGVVRDRVAPKELFLKRVGNGGRPDFKDPLETHRALADLSLRVYLTTNYDPFMTEALRHAEKDVEREFFRWSPHLRELARDEPSIFEREPGYRPTAARPLVFHLHGSDQLVDSLVLTEDDYIDFLTNSARGELALPPAVEQALTGSSLLFVGYSIADWNFRVLLNSLTHYRSRGARRLNVAVMTLPASAKADPARVQKYLTESYADIDVRVYWGTARAFVKELRERMGRA